MDNILSIIFKKKQKKKTPSVSNTTMKINAEGKCN